MGDDAGVANAALGVRGHARRRSGEERVRHAAARLGLWRSGGSRIRGAALLRQRGHRPLGGLPRGGEAPPAAPYLAIGRRWDCDIRSAIDFDDEGASLRGWAHENGRLDLGRGSDYFVYPRGTDFGLPAFAVGRPGWDNWMIGRALELRAAADRHDRERHGRSTRTTTTGTWRRVADPIGRARRPSATAGSAAGIERYLHSPSNATHLLTPEGLTACTLVAAPRARLEAFVALRPMAWPLRRLIRLLRRQSAGGSRS